MSETIYDKEHFSIVTQEDEYEGETIWIRDDLDEAYLSFTRDEMRDILPILQGWTYGFSAGKTITAMLLEACEKCERLLLDTGDPFRGDHWQMMQDIRGAIKKAKGEQP